MADIVYTFENSVYLNITNACPCKCKFCIRNNGDSVGDAQSLWFRDHSPSFAEIKAEIDAFDWANYRGEIIFCGYGEPTCALDTLLQTADYLKAKTGLRLRLNTNGLSDLINKKPTARLICEKLDCISVSLNAPDARKYNELCAPAFGEKSFDALCKFALECKSLGTEVKFSLVDVIPQEDIDACQKVADTLKIPLRVREYTAN